MELNGDRGGLLLEIIVCAIIIGIVGVGVLGMLAINRHFSVRARHKIEALNLAREKMEEFGSLDYHTLSSGSDNITFADTTAGTRAWTVTEVDWDGDLSPDGKAVTVKVSW